MDQDIGYQRQRSHDASLGQILDAQAAARDRGIDVSVSNRGHHWQFHYHDKVIFNFWPAAAKGQKPGNTTILRVRGWKHALAIATRISLTKIISTEKGQPS